MGDGRGKMGTWSPLFILAKLCMAWEHLQWSVEGKKWGRQRSRETKTVTQRGRQRDIEKETERENKDFVSNAMHSVALEIKRNIQLTHHIIACRHSFFYLKMK